jgi:hypothetical protein
VAACSAVPSFRRGRHSVREPPNQRHLYSQRQSLCDATVSRLVVDDCAPACWSAR